MYTGAPDQKGKTIREAYVEASSFLSRHGVEDARTSAEILLQYLLGWSRSQLLLQWQDPFPSDEELRWEVLLSRRAGGVPVQYLTGSQEFYGLTFQVTPAVLIPRPETEILVQEILARGSRLWSDGYPRLADIGTGSGAIPVTAAVNRPQWKIGAVDLSPDALKVARGNASRYGVEQRIDFREGDLLTPYLNEPIDLDILVSNPPYIRSDEIPVLQREVRDYEPHLALDGGEDGLIFYRRLVREMQLLPRIPRLVGFEVGAGQAQDVAAMLADIGGWDTIDIVKDLAGIERHVLAERS